MTRLAVVADVHCDDFGSKVDAETGLNARWVDTIRILGWVARDAKARGADALIVAGDLSEARHPAPWRVAQIGEAIAEFGGQTILLRGNHDGLRADRSIVDVLAAGRPGWSGFSRPGVELVQDVAVACLPYLDVHHLRTQPGYETLPPAELYATLGEAYLDLARGLYAQSKNGPAVLIVHQGLAGGLMSDAQAAFLGDQALVVDTRALTAIGFDAVLAGHFHKHQVLSERPLVAYAGAPYRTDFGEEHQEKGYLIVDVEAGSPAAMEFVPTPARRFVTIHGEDRGNLEDLDDVVNGAVVRVVDLDETADVAGVRAYLEACGAFDITEIRRRPAAAPSAVGGIPESLTVHEALEAYFADDPDHDALVEAGRELLAGVA